MDSQIPRSINDNDNDLFVYKFIYDFKVLKVLFIHIAIAWTNH